MAQAGDSYTTVIKQAHLEWGTHRYTDSRDRIYGEGYIQIPMNKARQFNVLNSNGTQGLDILGKNLFNCRSADGTFESVLKAQGCEQANGQYAKQFSANDDLKAVGDWYHRIGAQAGDIITVTWTSQTDIVISIIKRNG